MTSGLPCDDLSRLSREDLAIVLAFVQDRFINAVTGLDGRLQLERQCPGVVASDRTLQAAEHAVRKVLAAVKEVEAAAGGVAGVQ
jgi:hypothetical protein